MASITLSQLGHEVTVEHRLSHLNLLVSCHFVRSAVVTARAESSNSRLVEYLIFVALAVDVGKHVVDS